MLSSRSIQHIWTAVTSLVTRDRGRLLDDEIVDMNGNTNQALCDVLDEKEPAAGADANVEGGSEDLAALLQGTSRGRIIISLCTKSLHFVEMVLSRVAACRR